MDHLYKTTVDVLRQDRSLVNGVMSITWTNVAYSSMKCRIDLLFRDVRMQQFITAEAGKTPDRQGVMFYGAAFALRPGDRVRCTLGPVVGLYEVEDAPEIAIGLDGHHHEVHLREITTS